MNYSVRKIGITLTLLLALLAASLQIFWYPGITQKQTLDILLNDHKFGSRALGKAVWHGSDILIELDQVTNQFKSLNSLQASAIVLLIKRLDKIEITYGKSLYMRTELYPKLIGSVILAKSSYNNFCDENIFFLEQIIFRKYAGLEKNLFKLRDRYSDIAITAIGYCKGDRVYRILSDVLNETRVPYRRHKTAISSLVQLNDKRVIELLHLRIMDPKFKATLPAFNALLALGDLEAHAYAKKG